MLFIRQDREVFIRLSPEVEGDGNVLVREGATFTLMDENNRFATVQCETPAGESFAVVAPKSDLSLAVDRLIDQAWDAMIA
jgi:hypothetical protein